MHAHVRSTAWTKKLFEDAFCVIRVPDDLVADLNECSGIVEPVAQFLYRRVELMIYRQFELPMLYRQFELTTTNKNAPKSLPSLRGKKEKRPSEINTLSKLNVDQTSDQMKFEQRKFDDQRKFDKLVNEDISEVEFHNICSILQYLENFVGSGLTLSKNRQKLLRNTQVIAYLVRLLRIFFHPSSHLC